MALNIGTFAQDGPDTPEQISLKLPITGALAAATTATIRYRRKNTAVALGQTESYVTGHPLYRIQSSASLTPSVGTVENWFAWPIIDLRPNTPYEIEVTVNDGIAAPEVQTITCTTRALPPRAGRPNKNITAGTTGAAIQTAFSGLAAGDVIEFEAGTYTVSGLQLGVAGSAGNLIYIRGASRQNTILVDTTGTVLELLNTGYVVIENLTLRGSQTDSGTSASSRGVLFNSGFSPVQVTVRNCTITGVDVGIGADAEITQCLIYHNILTGNNLWTRQTTPGIYDIDTNLTWNDDGCRIPGFGNCAWNNTISGFGDAMSYSQASGGVGLAEACGVHFYRNDVLFTCDDATEVDDGIRNLTFYDNRIWNSMTFVSLDPIFGGPFLAARNISINTGRSPMKWNSQNSGHFFYNNTIVETTKKYYFDNPSDLAESGWYQANNGAQTYYGFRNNVLVYRGLGTSTIWLDSTGHTPVDFDYNSWYPDSNFHWGSNFANLATAYAGLGATTPIFSGHTKRHEQDNITVSNPWTSTVTLGSDYHTQVTTAYTPALSGGSAPKNSGVSIPGVTDGFTGGSPDRGAIIAGRPVPIYGNTVPAWAKLSVGAWYEVPNTNLSSVPPSPVPGGASGAASKIIAWTSFVADAAFSRVYSVANGGHQDYQGNEVDEFDYWREVPTVVERMVSTPGASYLDCTNYYSDGRPTARHTYYGAQLDEFDDRIMLFTGAGSCSSGAAIDSISSYNISANTYNGTGTHPNLSSLFLAPTITFTADPQTGNVYIVSENGTAKWTRSTNTFATMSPTGTVCPDGYGSMAAFDTKRGRAFFLGGRSSVRHHYTPATNVFVQVTLSGASASDVSGAVAYGMTYVEALDMYIVRGLSSGATIYQIDASTFAVTTFSVSGGASIPITQNGPYNKFLYLPELGGAIYSPDYSGNAWFLKTDLTISEVTSSSPGVTAVAPSIVPRLSFTLP